jgi:hypothetical protein
VLDTNCNWRNLARVIVSVIMASLSRYTSQLRVLGRAFSAQPSTSTFPAGSEAVKLPALPYGYSALEPIISGEIMELHHSKHHNAYVTNYNKALEQWAEAEKSQDSIAAPKIASALHFNGGGSLLSPDVPLEDSLRRTPCCFISKTFENEPLCCLLVSFASYFVGTHCH